VPDFKRLLEPLAGPAVVEITSAATLAAQFKLQAPTLLLAGVGEEEQLSRHFFALAMSMRHDFKWATVRPNHAAATWDDNESSVRRAPKGHKALLLLKPFDERRHELSLDDFDANATSKDDFFAHVQQWSAVWALQLIGEHGHSFDLTRRYTFARIPIARTFLPKPFAPRESTIAMLKKIAKTFRGRLAFTVTESEYGSSYLMTEFGALSTDSAAVLLIAIVAAEVPFRAAAQCRSDELLLRRFLRSSYRSDVVTVGLTGAINTGRVGSRSAPERAMARG
jgi:hypothetical protein